MIKKQRTKRKSLLARIFKKQESEQEAAQPDVPKHDPTEISFSGLDDNGLIINSGTATYGAYSLDRKESLAVKSDSRESSSCQNTNILVSATGINPQKNEACADNQGKIEPEYPPVEIEENINKKLLSSASGQKMAYIYRKNPENEQLGDNYIEIGEDGVNLDVDFTSESQDMVVLKSPQNFEISLPKNDLSEPINIKTNKDISIKINLNSNNKIRILR